MFAAVDFDLYVGLAVAGDTVDFGLGNDTGDGASFLTSLFPGEEGSVSFLVVFSLSCLAFWRYFALRFLNHT